ncbi:MAG: hypothetical protein A3C53_07830 [Omnitrophica WOR_2 bacterium RIFCSPHIGHO2_02_FULL_68_15]|nr:MAG: hypothetical protein A3C53_07830 [Omnitrophica WOR_2 bacterium RIFCSPHIGHO2_02_FULL_68_15]
MKIAVLAGGISCEREISLISGRAVLEALRGLGHEACFIDAADDFIKALREKGIQHVFLALHGTFGEDGTVQRVLDREGIRYTGSGPEASEKAFDKPRAQALFKQTGIPVPDHRVCRKGERVPEAVRFPLVIKPARSGSSCGVSLVRERGDFRRACELAFRYSDEILLEQYIPGRELTVGILGEEALPVVEIIAANAFYDYQAKYSDDRTRYEAPARLKAPEAAALQRHALAAFRALGCRGMARADFMLDAAGRPYLLEVNTIPGLTGKSLLPKAAAAAGTDFGALCARIMELSWSNRQDTDEKTAARSSR